MLWLPPPWIVTGPRRPEPNSESWEGWWHLVVIPWWVVRYIYSPQCLWIVTGPRRPETGSESWERCCGSHGPLDRERSPQTWDRLRVVGGCSWPRRALGSETVPADLRPAQSRGKVLVARRYFAVGCFVLEVEADYSGIGRQERGCLFPLPVGRPESSGSESSTVLFCAAVLCISAQALSDPASRSFSSPASRLSLPV